MEAVRIESIWSTPKKRLQSFTNRMCSRCPTSRGDEDHELKMLHLHVLLLQDGGEKIVEAPSTLQRLTIDSKNAGREESRIG